METSKEPASNAVTLMPVDAITFVEPESEITTLEATLEESSMMTEDNSQDCNTMSLNLRTAALSVQLQTKTAASGAIAELATKLECATSRVSDLENRLTHAIYRIGFLEAQLAEKDRIIADMHGNGAKL